jgi:hypothetical protein
MPWHNRSKMSLKLEFVMLADQEEANMSALCSAVEKSPPSSPIGFGYGALRCIPSMDF